MSSISSIVLPLYQKYASALSKHGGMIDLSVKDPHLSVSCPKTTSSLITDFINYTIKNTRKPHLIIQGNDKYLIIKEENTLLEPNFKVKLTGVEGMKISSRIGFGTKLQFPLK
ncbi:hypothetical protein IJG27_00465 [Candidatus Saccharibacteria bacterium]|nr:hypothetical protein [Candidatus Saccharibacteria bacterium]MBQ6127380.1 hypothetical protein [Candidatus Saccharibacteria bacterium]